MKLPTDIPVYGDPAFRGDCPKESVEQVTFFAEIRKQHPEIGDIAIHVPNEAKRTWEKAAWDKANGLVTGACDIMIPGSPSLLIELKRKDHTRSKLGKKQIPYMRAAQARGSAVCIALGWEAAMEAVEEWLKAHG